MKTETELLSDLHLAMYDLERATQTLDSGADAVAGARENLSRVEKRVAEEHAIAFVARAKAQDKVDEAKKALMAHWRGA